MLKQNQENLTTAWQQYRSGVDYNTRTNYYTTVDRNYRFYKGDQWIGVPSGNLTKPVFNIFKRVINYFVSSILSQAVKGQYSVENIPDLKEGEIGDPNSKEQKLRDFSKLLSDHAELRWERDKMNHKLQQLLIDGSCSGDMATYTYWDSNKKTGQDAEGDFCTEIVDGVNVMFGNPNCNEVEKQPYILVIVRELVSKLKKEAENNGVSEDEIKNITSDNETEYQAGDSGKVELENTNDVTGKCTCVIKFWKKDGTIWWSKSTKHVEIRKEVDMDIRRYPVAFGNWEEVKNSYHGQAVGTGLIDNQIYINKQFAMTMLWLMSMAYGKVIYDATRITGWSNQLNAAIQVQGDVNGAVQQVQPGQMSGMVITFIDKAIQYTKEMLGATDAGLGEVRPENTSAIIALQKAAAVPLQVPQSNLYQFVEDIYLIWGEFILRKYNANRTISYQGKDGIETQQINTEEFRDILLNVKVDVGPSSYWSELASVQTLDNLLINGHLDVISYLERVPAGFINKKQELIDKLKAQMQQAPPPPAPEQPPVEQAPPDDTQMYEQMAMFMESLPPDVQQQLRELPDAQLEETLMQMMQQQN